VFYISLHDTDPKTSEKIRKIVARLLISLFCETAMNHFVRTLIKNRYICFCINFLFQFSADVISRSFPFKGNSIFTYKTNFLIAMTTFIVVFYFDLPHHSWEDPAGYDLPLPAVQVRQGAARLLTPAYKHVPC
jgi:hypothetical protein